MKLLSIVIRKTEKKNQQQPRNKKLLGNPKNSHD